MANIENSKLELLSHQNEAYEEVEKLFEQEGKAAVIFPTGCGKSFVTLKYILEHPDDRILFLSPRNAIKEQMYEYVIRYIGGDTRDVNEIVKEYGSLKKAAKSFIPNLECALYQTILGIGEKDSVDNLIDNLKPDLIVIDEMHHLKTKKGADKNQSVILDDEDDKAIEEIKEENEWGRKFQELLDRNPQSKVLGLSATPIRMDGANVVERIFENAIAKEISLLEAMEEGIIYPPEYVIPDFVRKEELQTLLEKINSAEGERKVRLKEEYDELVKKSSEAPGIPELLDKHITERNGKYIIFCKDIKDMENKKSQAKEWFEEIDEEPEIHSISSKDKNSQQYLEEFNKSTSNHLKLMYCVGMIDEGVHLDNVSGVILAAKTGSRPTYLQRLGRAISSGENKKQALVIDLVNNNEILFDDNQKQVQYGYEINDVEALEKAIDWINEHNDGELPEYSEEKSHKERTIAKRLNRLKNKYLKYEQDSEELEVLNEEKKTEVQKIIELGKEIDLWSQEINFDIETELDTDFYINQFLDNIEIKGARKSFREILEESSESKNTVQEFIEKIKILQSVGVDTSKLIKTDTIESLAKKSGIAKEKIEEMGLKLEDKIGQSKNSISQAYRGKGRCNPPTQEQVEELKKLGISLELQEQKNTVQEFIEKLKKMQSIGVDVSELKQRHTIESLAQKAGISKERIEELGLKLEDKIGQSKTEISRAYRGKGNYNPPTQEQVEELKKLGISLELQEQKNTVQEFIEKIKKLQSIGIDTSNLGQKVTIESLAQKSGIAKEKIEEVGLKLEDKIGVTKMSISQAYRGIGSNKPPTQEQVEELKQLGISLETKKKSATKVGKAVVKEVSVEESKKAAEFMEEITNENEKKGEIHDEK